MYLNKRLINLFSPKKLFLFSALMGLLFSVFTPAAVRSQSAPANPNSAKECAVCHYRWIDTFFVEGRGSELVDYQSERVVASREMCFSCHDGSIADSRAIAFNDFMHQTDAPAPAHIKIPAGFPLGKSGGLTCATCHTPHGVPSGPGTDETVFMRFSNKNSALCTMCHAGMSGGSLAGNHPLGQSKQSVPVRLIELGAHLGKKPNQVVCETCHAAHGSPNEGFLIQSARNSALCLTCHDDKSARTADGQKRPNHVVNVKPLNAAVPAGMLQNGSRLGPSGEIICLTCHKVHQNSIKEKLLVIRQDKASTLCLSCHIDKQVLFKTKHNLINSAPREKNFQGQTAADGGICSACHLPHQAARNPGEMADKDYTTRLCLSCHREGHVAASIKMSGNTHPLNVSPFEEKPAGSSLKSVDIEPEKLTLPLFNEIGIPDPSGKMTCSTCHDPHGSRMDDPKRPEAGQVRAISFFLRKESSFICRECHSSKFSVADTKHDLRHLAPEKAQANIFDQTPEQSGLCGTCHAVHGSQKGFLWARGGSKSKADASFDLCASCHNPQGPASKKIIGEDSHPLDISLTAKGLTTTLPLFRKEGLITCYSCHDPHRRQTAAAAGASDADKPITAAFLRMPSPELCRACHPAKFAVANSKHDLRKAAPEARNLLKQTPAQAGLCSSCHIVHGSKQALLWARPIVEESGDPAYDLCASCHREAGPAGKKVLNHYSHPLNILPADKGLTTTLPLFDNNGRRAVNGRLTCHTCHDPHRWDPSNLPEADHSTQEGDGRNSFLRMGNSPAPVLCENCHPAQAAIEKTDHDLSASSPAFKNQIGQTPLESGPCGVCHLVHNSKNKARLWALDYGAGDSFAAGLCTGCHSKNGAAKNKIPKVASHPEGKLIVNVGRDQKGRPDYFPLFDKSTGKPVGAGNISCPSCHNAHQWDPKSLAKGNGSPLEGNAGNSFLRMRSDQFLCKDCHGIEALSRLYYFHVPGKRVFLGD